MVKAMATETAGRPYGAVLRGPGFRLLFAGQALSQLGDWVNRVALLLLVYRLTGREAAVAVVLLAQALPRALVLPFGGVLADRWPKRRLMIATDLLRAALALSLLLVDAPRDLPRLWATVVLMQLLAALFTPARGAALPALVPATDLPAANALVGLSGELAFFVGPALGGLVVARWGVGAAFALNAASFLLSAALLARLRLAEPPRAGVAPAAIGRDLAEGGAVVRRDPTLALLFACLFALAAIAIGLNTLLLGLLAGPLGRPPTDLGPLLALVGLGGIGGTLLAPRLLARWPGGVRALAAGATLALAADLALIGGARHVALVAVGLALNGLLSLVVETLAEATIGRRAPGPALGRVFGLYFWVATLGQVAGALAGGLLPRALGPGGAALALAAGAAALPALALARTARPTGGDAPPPVGGTEGDTP